MAGPEAARVRAAALGAAANLVAVGASGLTLGIAGLFLPLGGLGIVLCTVGWLVGLAGSALAVLRVRALPKPVPAARVAVGSVGWKG